MARASTDDFKRLRATGDARLREELTSRYIPLARTLAARYGRAREQDEDLQQVACLGLVKAVDRFDPERGPSFVAFATPTILGELRRHFRQTSWRLHVPRALQERTLALRAVSDELVAELKRSPTPSELAARMGATVEEVVEAMAHNACGDVESLDHPVAESEALSYHDVVGGDDAAYEAVEDEAAVAPAIRALPRRERTILGLRYFCDLTQAEIAERLDMSQMQVSRTLRRTIDELATEVQPEAA